MSSASTRRANLSSTTKPSPKTDPPGFWFCPMPYQKEIEAVDRKERELVPLGIRKIRTIPGGLCAENPVWHAQKHPETTGFSHVSRRVYRV